MRLKQTTLGYLFFGCGLAAGLGPAARSEEPGVSPPPLLTVEAAYLGEGWRIASGGIGRDRSAYLDYLGVSANLDLGRAMGLDGATFYASAFYGNGEAISADGIGDLNVVSNIESGVEGVRLLEAWIDQTFAGDAGSLRVGLYDLNSEFDAGEVRGLFIGASHGLGTELAQTAPSSYPVTSFGARLNWNFGDGLYARAAVLDGVPGDPDHPKRTTIDLSGADGAFYAAEIGFEDDGGTHLSLGAWSYTRDFEDVLSGAPRDGNWGAYAAVEHSLLTKDGGAPFDLAGSLRFGVADDAVNPVSSFLAAALVATGAIAARPDDRLGLAISVANTGGEFRQRMALDGADPAHREINVELTYQAALTEWLTVQPTIQWIANPGADRDNDDALVFGLRLEAAKSWTVD